MRNLNLLFVATELVNRKAGKRNAEKINAVYLQFSPIL
jgi:hypothetical protein